VRRTIARVKTILAERRRHAKAAVA
jgi:ribosomal protein L29